jgi:type III secretion system HrpB2-like protein
MTTPIPVPPIESALASPGLTATPPAPPAVQDLSTAELAERFESFYKRGPETDAPAGVEEPSMLSRFLTQQDNAARQGIDDVKAFGEAAPHMTPAELHTHSMELANKASINSFKMHAAVAVGSGTTKSLQQLLKNS